MDQIDTINNLNSLLDSCLLPQLKDDIGTNVLDSSSFESFRQSLDVNLNILFDLIQTNEIFFTSTDSEFVQVKTKLILLICEETTSNNFYKTRTEKFLKNFYTLEAKYFEDILSKNEKVNSELIQFYKTKLKAHSWKKNIGAVCGFLRFLQLRYSKRRRIMDVDIATFILAVGLLLKDFYDPMFKAMGVEMFTFILNYLPESEIKKTNMHEVIYKELYEDFKKFDKPDDIYNVWNCLYSCLKLNAENFKNEHKWNENDNLLKSLIHEINFAKTPEVWNELFKFITKLYLISSDSKIMKIIDDDNIVIDEKISKLRSTQIEPSTIFFRWAKHLLELFVVESNYLMGSNLVATNALQIMHITYLVCVIPVPIQLLCSHLAIFLEKFSIVLMESLRMHSNHFQFRQNTLEFLRTLINQMDETNIASLMEYKNAFLKLLNHKLFAIEQI